MRRHRLLALAAVGIAVAGITPASARSYSITGHCTFGGVLLPDDTLTGTFGGVAVASSTGVDVPVSTTVYCSITNGTDFADSTDTMPGGAAATMGTYAGWPRVAITVCTSASATFLPSGITIVYPLTCV